MMEESCKTCFWNSNGECCAPIPEWVYGLLEEYEHANFLHRPYTDCEVYKPKEAEE